MRRKVFVFVLFFLFATSNLTSCASYYRNPSQDLLETELEGTWEAHYGMNRIDRITIRKDGTFTQTYEDEQTNYQFKTNWNSWWLEYLDDGSVYIHLKGGRFYPAGIRIAELEGMDDPCPNQIPPDCNQFSRSFWNPYSGKPLRMPGELVLIVKVDLSGELVFHHMMQSPDVGIAIFGGDIAIFHKITTNG